MAKTVGGRQVSAFTGPNNGDSLDADVVKANDTSLRTQHNGHDADAALHVQSGTLAERPAAGTIGRVWVVTSGASKGNVYYDDGSAWELFAYAPSASPTFTGTVTIGAGGKLDAADATLLVDTPVQVTGAAQLDAGLTVAGIAKGSAQEHNSVGATETLDFTSKQQHDCDIDQNTTLTITAGPTGTWGIIRLRWLGAYTITWAASSGTIRWPGNGATPSFTRINGRVDYLMAYFNGTDVELHPGQFNFATV